MSRDTCQLCRETRHCPRYCEIQAESRERYPKEPRAYLEDWAAADAAYLRRFYPPGDDEVHYEVTPAFEKACAWVMTLKGRSNRCSIVSGCAGGRPRGDGLHDSAVIGLPHRVAAGCPGLFSGVEAALGDPRVVAGRRIPFETTELVVPLRTTLLNKPFHGGHQLVKSSYGAA
jgi:Protein of unknown function (DUF3375)